MKSVDSFIDKFWPLPLDSSTGDIWKKLREKYGDQALDLYFALIEEVRESGYQDESIQKIYAHMAKTCMDQDFPEETVLRSRRTLRFLLERYQERGEFTAADLGCGSGMISLGLAAYLPNLQSIHAIDRCTPAMDNILTNVRKLPEPLRRPALKKLNRYYGDCTSSEFAELVKNQHPEGVDIALAAYLDNHKGQPSHDLVSTMKEITKPNGELVICRSFNDSYIDERVAKFFADSLINEVAREHGLEFRPIYSEILNRDDIFVVMAAENTR